MGPIEGTNQHVSGDGDTPRDIPVSADSMPARGLVAFVPDRESRNRLRVAAGSRFQIRFCDTWEDLVALIELGRAVAVIVEPRDASGVPIAPRVRQLREGYPSMPIVAYVHDAETFSRDILELARAGVNELVRARFDDVGIAFRSALASANVSCTAERLLNEISPAVPQDVWPHVAFCIERAGAPLSVRDVADAFAVDPRTIDRRFRQSGLPSPREVIGWSRLLVASTLLEDAGRPVEQVAYALEFPSGAALRNMLRRYTDLRPQELRENGGHRCILHLFKQAMQSGRELAATS
jgi:AraC-like DNA-binding protein